MKYETPELKIEVFELADDIAAISGIGGGTTGGGGGTGDEPTTGGGTGGGGETTSCTCGPILEEDEPFYEKVNGMFDSIF